MEIVDSIGTYRSRVHVIKIIYGFVIFEFNDRYNYIAELCHPRIPTCITYNQI